MQCWIRSYEKLAIWYDFNKKLRWQILFSKIMIFAFMDQTDSHKKINKKERYNDDFKLGFTFVIYN